CVATCTWGSEGRAVRAKLALNEECLEAFDYLTSNGVEAPTIEAPMTAAFETGRQAAALLHELKRINESGMRIEYAALTGDELRSRVPQISTQVRAGGRRDGQRDVDPGRFAPGGAEPVTARGGRSRGGLGGEGGRP